MSASAILFAGTDSSVQFPALSTSKKYISKDESSETLETETFTLEQSVSVLFAVIVHPESSVGFVMELTMELTVELGSGIGASVSLK